MLAGLFKAPAKYAPHVNLPAARARANVVLTNLVQGGFMTEGQVLSARAASGQRRRPRRHARAPTISSTGPSTRSSASPPKSGIHSMVARTTIDMDIQQAAEESLEFNLRQYGKEYGVTEGAIVVLETSGAVRAIVGGRDYGESQFNRATRALRQTGSSFKPYVYATAMENGFTPESRHLRRADHLGRLVAEELRPQLFRPHDADHRAGQVDQHRAGAARQGPPVASPPIKAMAEGDGRRIADRAAQDHGARHVGHDGHGPGDRLQRLRRTAAMPARATASPSSSPHAGDVIYDFDRDAPQAAARAVANRRCAR